MGFLLRRHTKGRREGETFVEGGSQEKQQRCMYYFSQRSIKVKEDHQQNNHVQNSFEFYSDANAKPTV